MKKWIIEKRLADGTLDLSEPQPWSYFGLGSVDGISEDAMAKAIYRTRPNAILDGRHISTWPAIIDPKFVAREKTW